MKTLHSLSILGCLETGLTLSTLEHFDPRDLINCIPVLSVRDPMSWMKRLSCLGINVFAKRNNREKSVSYACATSTGSLTLIIQSQSPQVQESVTWEAINIHGAHFSELLFFCSSLKALQNASSICLESLNISKKESETTSYGTSCSISVYQGVTYTFLAQHQDSIFLEGFIPFEIEPSFPDPQLDAKLDHIVQNAPKELYRNLCQMFIKMGFEATFDGADTVEFKTTAFSPSGGIFDKMPFFALNSSDNEKSQINVGIQQYGGPFIQHLAIHVNNWCNGAEAMQRASIPLMGKERRNAMGDYYEIAKPLYERVFPENDFKRFNELGGLFDEDCIGEGRQLGLQQAFFNTIDSIDLKNTGRLTCFLEIIQRSAHELSEGELLEMDRLKGACAGFGKGNFEHLAGDVTFHGHELGVETKL